MLQEEQIVFHHYCNMILLDEPFDKLVPSTWESVIKPLLTFS